MHSVLYVLGRFMAHPLVGRMVAALGAAAAVLLPLGLALRSARRAGSAEADARHAAKEAARNREALDAQTDMLDAAARRPGDRGALTERLRDGRF